MMRFRRVHRASFRRKKNIEEKKRRDYRSALLLLLAFLLKVGRQTVRHNSMARCVSLIRVVCSRHFLRSSDRLIPASVFIPKLSRNDQEEISPSDIYTDNRPTVSPPTEINVEVISQEGAGEKG